MREAGDSRRLQVHGRARRDVVQNHGQVGRLDGGSEVPIEPFLCRTVVGRRRDQQARDGQLRQPAHALDGGRCAAGARSSDDRHAPLDILAGALRQLSQLRLAQRSGFARAAADDDAVRAVRQMKIEKPLPRSKIDRAVGPHGRDDGDQTT